MWGTLWAAIKAVGTAGYWVKSGKAIARTAVAAFIPVLTVVAAGGTVDWSYTLLAVGLTVVAAILTAMVGIPEDITSNPVLIVVFRFLRQWAQYLVAATASAALLTDVVWPALLAQATVSAITTVLIAALDVTSLDSETATE